ncbi:unnamed protein product [Moneuplotes crassus]|uniref:Uncharacterized protein n=1 Tax=Euplotes crassus TaxID=5936 RepID=A0AAD1UCG1_EUPCR|nr:unnamed protein product [Moneuplotes crassus]
MESIKAKFEAKSKSKKTQIKLMLSALKRRAYRKSKFVKVNRRNKLNICDFKSLAFSIKRKKVARNRRNRGCFSQNQTSRRTRIINNKEISKFRMGPKSPIPTTTRRMQLKPFNSDMGHQNERYVTIIKKAQKAFRNSSRGLESPKILQKFLSTQESFNSQGKLLDFLYFAFIF